MEHQLQRALGYVRASTLCVHWRAEDFHHPSTLLRHRLNGTAAAAAVQIAARARAVAATSVLVVTNARFEALEELAARLRAASLSVHSSRSLAETTFGCRSSYVYAAVAEMLACSRARHFLGTPRSSFSFHIVAMRAAAREGAATANGTIDWLA